VPRGSAVGFRRRYGLDGLTRVVKALVILAHPDPNSFSHAIAETALTTLGELGHHVAFHDLEKEGFDPVLPSREIPEDGKVVAAIREHCEDLVSADGIIVIHPNWWGMPPAILKGWIDRVMRPGVAYRFLENDSGGGVPVGLLRAKTAVVFNTSNTPSEREQDVFGDPLEALWKTCIFDLCGVKSFHRRMFGVMVTSTPEQRARWLDEVRDTVNRLFPAW
jgi:NAD(P)H dehydrogenase (quinone)